MKFFVKLIIGMVLFNAFVLFLTPFFPTHTTISGNAADVTNQVNISKYGAQNNLVSVITNIFLDPTVLIVFTSIFGIGALVSLVLSGSHNVPLSIGISIFVAFVASLYMGTIKVFNSLCEGYPMIYTLLGIITLVIGIYFVFSISEMFSGRSDLG